jgi:hypothetical protein
MNEKFLGGKIISFNSSGIVLMFYDTQGPLPELFCFRLTTPGVDISFFRKHSHQRLNNMARVI